MLTTMNALLCLALSCMGFVSGKPSDGYAAATPTYSQPMSYEQPAYAEPSYDVQDVTKIVDYDYAVNDYYGNEQTRREHVEPGKQIGHWTARMADGALETVDYEAGAYGNLAHVVVRQSSYPTSTYAAAQPTYSTPHSVYKRSVSYGAPSYMSYTAPKMASTYAAPSYGHSMYKRSASYDSPSYAAPAQTYSAPAAAYVKVAPKVHYNYEEKNIYVPQTYAAPASYAKAAPKMHYNYEEKNVYVAPATTYAAPQSYAAPMPAQVSY